MSIWLDKSIFKNMVVNIELHNDQYSVLKPEKPMKKSLFIRFVLCFVLVTSIITSSNFVMAKNEYFLNPDVEYIKTLNPVESTENLKKEISNLELTSFKNQEKSNLQKFFLLAKADMINMSLKKANYSAASVIIKNFEKYSSKWINKNSVQNITKTLNLLKIAIKDACKTTVSTSYGQVSGVDGGNGSWLWAGIPYAKPPLGELRWKAPQDPEPWKEIRYSTFDFSRSIQPSENIQWLPTNKIEGSEDCLYLNIYRPKNCDNNLPVYFWIHGGGNTKGGADQFNLSYMANKCNMVIVVIQYRLGPFGWFYHPDMNTNGTKEERSGNFAILDMIKALKWVQDNISEFGGNHENVTIAGESAGGYHILNLMASPLAKGLFHRAISQSAAGFNAPQASITAVINSAIDNLLISEKICTTPEEATLFRSNMSPSELENYLKGKTPEEIISSFMDQQGAINTLSSIGDGYVLPASLHQIFDSGNYNQVPVIIGSNRDEMKPFFPFTFGPLQTASGHTWNNLYNVLNLEEPYMSLEQVLPSDSNDRYIFETCTDLSSLYWKASVDKFSRAFKKHQDSVYSYWFMWGHSDVAPSPYNYLLGAGHSFELPFFFGDNPDFLGNLLYTKDNYNGRLALQNAMMTYISSFVRYGNPNKNNKYPTWEKWSNIDGEPKTILFDANLKKEEISMINREYNKTDLETQINGLPSPAMEMTYPLLWSYPW